MTELEILREDNSRLRADLAATERECAILRSTSQISYGKSTDRVVVQVGSRERMAMLEHAIERLDSFVREVDSDDCLCYDETDPDDHCRTCRARKILDEVKTWRFGGSTTTPSRRFEGALHYRVSDGWNPRETKIHAAWCKYFELHGADPTLGQILTDRQVGQPDGVRDWPTARDWYVATSIVQWLVTNCGSQILEQAGWKYAGWDEDRVSLDEKRKELHP